MGMILAQNCRWKHQVNKKMTVVVDEKKRNRYGLEFKVGLDPVQNEYIRRILTTTDFSAENKPVQCLRFDDEQNRWEVNKDGEVVMGENKRKFFCEDHALLSHGYDIRIAAATETAAPAAATARHPKHTHERIKKRTTYRYKNSASLWQVDVTEVETRPGGQGQGQGKQGERDVELEFELLDAAKNQYLGEKNEAAAIERTKVIAAQLLDLVERCLGGLGGAGEGVSDPPLERAQGVEVQVRLLVEDIKAKAGLTIGQRLDFVGCMPVNLSRRTLPVVLGTEYFVTEKSDGLRYLLFVVPSAAGSGATAVLMNRAKELFTVPGSAAIGSCLGSGTVLDGELVWNLTLRRHVFLVFDALLLPGVAGHCHLRAFSERLRLVQEEVLPRLAELRAGPGEPEPVLLVRKVFSDKGQISALLGRIRSEAGSRVFHDSDRRHHRTDGLVFQPKAAPYCFYSDPQLLKWKYEDLRSVDLLCLADLAAVQQPAVKLLCSGPDNTLIDCSKRMQTLGRFDSWRLLADMNHALRLRQQQRPVAEVVFDAGAGMWSYLQLRPDKGDPNFIDTVMGVLVEQAESVSLTELEYRLLPGPDDYAHHFARTRNQLLVWRRSEADKLRGSQEKKRPRESEDGRP